MAVAGFAGFLFVGNLTILAASLWARTVVAPPLAPAVQGVDNFRVVDGRLWRGAAPTRTGYRSLAAAGVDTVVDLRAEDGLDVDEARMADLGLRRVAIPMRDGQTPTGDEVARFLAAVGDGRRVFVHCGAGVGRTGTMVAAYLVATGQADGWSALRSNLAVGPPSLEQVVFAANLAPADSLQRGPAVVAAVSRLLDAPRRLWTRLRA
jgi:hypothetical protein